jgi:large subunit ribosomal protein L29
MKASEIRNLALDEIQRKASEMKEELFNLRFQHEIGQLENPQRMKAVKKDIARLKTIMHEVILKQGKDKE